MDNQALYHAMGQTLQNSMGHMPVGAVAGGQPLAAPPPAQVPAMATQPVMPPVQPPIPQVPVQQAPVVGQVPVPGTVPHPPFGRPGGSFLSPQRIYHGGLI